ncbi:MAG: tRNA (adenosine(37)-N6)-threonylcarbamoyltransferase complex dimerization subunit type 1 TsaB [Holosporaceae bacterium]|jgi:tRNA threonylcarbamoyladenosine biosynthesis protein TsaB|nr:tRNA (adenosine(37)-N6)-threonylcarbamoyltransferase complex dimerization subunit type 1 TsaB [Holosporaceae bacterium]
MKNLMAVTACLKRCSIAISYENKFYEINENVDASANLVHLAHNLAQSKDIDLKKISGVITASGPGSFTGIRVAQSFAKGLAMSLKIPSTSVSYFEVIKNICREKNIGNNTLVVIGSEKGQLYYETNDNNFHKIGISAPDALGRLLSDKFFLVGDSVDEVVHHWRDRIIGVCRIDDFRNAKHLLNFAEALGEKSRISPLYINAQSNCRYV